MALELKLQEESPQAKYGEREFSLEEAACYDPRVVNAGAGVYPEGGTKEKTKSKGP